MTEGGQEPLDKFKILEVTPLRCLSPVFPSPPGMLNSQASSPFLFVPPSGPFPSGVAPVYPFMGSNGGQRTGLPSANNIPSPLPQNAFGTPSSASRGRGRGKRGRPRKVPVGIGEDGGGSKVPVGIVGDGGGYSDGMNQSNQYVNVQMS